MNRLKSLHAILIIGLFLRMISLNQSFWLDEAAQATISSQSLWNVNWAADFSPPLFYILTHLWQLLGIFDEWFLRLVPVFFGVVTIIVMYRFVKELFDEKSALVTSLFLATAPYHVYYSQEYRMYSFLTFLISASWYMLWKKNWLWYALLITAAFFTHYFSFLVIISQIVFVFIYQKKDLKKFITSLVPATVLFYIWTPIFLKQLKTASQLISAWPSWKTVAGTPFLKFPFLVLAKFSVGMISIQNKALYAFVVFVIGTIFAYALFRLSRQSLQRRGLLFRLREPEVGLLLFYLFIPLLFSWIAGLWISGNSPHRLLFVLPAFYAIIGVGLTRNVKVLSIVFILINNLFFSFFYLITPANHREDWRGAVSYTDSRVNDTSLALTEYLGPWAPMDWYSKKPQSYIGASTTIPITEQSISDKLVPILSSNESRVTSNIFLYTYLFEISDPQKLVENYLLKNNYHITSEKDFRGVGIIKTYKFETRSTNSETN